MKVDQTKMWNMISDNPSNYYVSANDDERKLMRDWVKGLLLEREITIEFDKADGTKREMTCTLKEDQLPLVEKKDPLTQKKVRAINEDVQVVWDTSAQSWRSFRWDRLNRINFSI